MELTPIRIRGRRKRNRPSQGGDIDALTIASTTRSRKNARLNQPSLQVVKKKPRFDPKLSVFEQLPTEIIQNIFAYCDNISLPLTSFMFARQLSHHSIYIRYSVDTLGKKCTSCSTQTLQDGDCDNAPAVSRMLQCKWMSWTIFKNAVRELQSRWARERLSSESDDGYAAAPNFDRPDEQGLLDYLHLHPRVQVPQKLLQAPWTQDKTAFLYYLIWNNVGVDWEHSSRGEIATQGLQQAIQARSRQAVASLLSPLVGVVPTAAAIRAAVVDHGCDQTLVFCLLNAALRAHVVSRAEARLLTDFSFRDPSLWSWAGRMRSAGNRKGAWLTAALKYAGDVAARSSAYDGDVVEDFRRECGRESDGVEQIAVPLHPRSLIAVESRVEEVEG